MTALPVQQVNRQVTIEQVCTWIGWPVRASSDRRSAKYHCPFGEFNHSDGGRERAFRIYPGNTAYCFACKQYFTPVSLFARASDLSLEDAAARLAELAGLRPRDWQELWDYAEPRRGISTDDLARALRLRCQSIPGWSRLQYVPEIAECVARALALVSDVRTDDEAGRWLDSAARSIAITAERVSTGD